MAILAQAVVPHPGIHQVAEIVKKASLFDRNRYSSVLFLLKKMDYPLSGRPVSRNDDRALALS